MPRSLFPILCFVLAPMFGAACAREPAQAAASSATPAVEHDPSTPHGDHTPRYGGIVYMQGDLHFELVFEPAGGYRVYFSDEVRAELPASAVAGLTIAVSRPGEPVETLAGRIDESGESWIAEGRPVEALPASARVAFAASDGSYWIDVPLLRPGPP